MHIPKYVSARLLLACLLGIRFFLPLSAMAAEPPIEAMEKPGPVLPLSPKLRAALIAEMAGIKQGVAELAPLLAMGEWKRAAKGAERIRDSYIMKQELSPADLHELEHALPVDFSERDARFHSHADGLARAARAQNSELAVFYFSRMLEGCSGCHSHYATHVLPGFPSPQPAAHQH